VVGCALANQRRRFGDRRFFILLRHEGELSGIYRIYRLNLRQLANTPTGLWSRLDERSLAGQ
jgi:hypothetical protein